MLSVRPELAPAELRAALQASARAFPTSGAGNDENGQPVPMCRAPDGVDQLQCYCAVGLCGAGMLDAPARGGGRAGHRGTHRRGPTGAAGRRQPAPERRRQLGRQRGAASAPISGRWSMVAARWRALPAPSTPPTALLVPAGAGTVVVSLTLTDDLGAPFRGTAQHRRRGCRAGNYRRCPSAARRWRWRWRWRWRIVGAVGGAARPCGVGIAPHTASARCGF